MNNYQKWYIENFMVAARSWHQVRRQSAGFSRYDLHLKHFSALIGEEVEGS